MSTASHQSPYTEIRTLVEAAAHILWTSRFILLSSSVVGAALGLVQAYRSPEIWESRMLVAAVQEASADKMKSLGSLLGKASPIGGEDMELFTTVFVSERIGRKILKTNIASPDSLSKTHPISTFLRLDTSNAKKTDAWVSGMNERFSIGPMAGKSASILQITLVSGKPWLSQAILQAAYDSTSAEVMRIRSARLQTQIPHLQYASREAAGELDLITRKITQFQAENRSIVSPEFLGRQDSLNRERQVLERKYLAIRQEVEEAQISLVKMSPPCIVVDPAKLPTTKSGPRRMLTVLFSMLFFFSAASAIILGREVLR